MAPTLDLLKNLGPLPETTCVHLDAGYEASERQGERSDGFSRMFAGVLEASTRPFHAINYIGSLGGPRLLGYAGMGRRFDRVVARLSRRLDRESDTELSKGMHYPTSWDPYFKAYMTLADVYRYPTRHFEHHRRQLTLGCPE